MFLFRSNAFLQLHETSHVWGQVALFAARRRRLIAAVLLVLVGHHLLDAYHGFGLTDEWNLEEEEEEEQRRLYVGDLSHNTMGVILTTWCLGYLAVFHMYSRKTDVDSCPVDWTSDALTCSPSLTKSFLQM